MEMASFSQSPRDRILWILANNGGRMERSGLRARAEMRYALLNPILEGLARESKIKRRLEAKVFDISNRAIGLHRILLLFEAISVTPFAKLPPNQLQKIVCSLLCDINSKSYSLR
jgi:hypothetical protein